jgi:hypothetical protein
MSSKKFEKFCEFNDKLKKTKRVALYDVKSVNIKQDYIKLVGEDGREFEGKISELVANIKAKKCALKNPSRLVNYDFKTKKKDKYGVTFHIVGYKTILLTDSDYKDFEEEKRDALNEICGVDFGALEDIDSDLVDNYPSDSEDGVTQFVFHVHGYYYKEVEADSVKEAKEVAEHYYYDEDFGELSDIEYDVDESYDIEKL